MTIGAAPGKAGKTRLVLADDNTGVLDEVKSLLAPEFDVVAAVHDGAALVRSASECRPDVVITDVRMPVLGGIEASQEILRNGFCRSIILLSTYSEAEIVGKALRLGILGYVLKIDAAEELIPAVHRALDGKTYLSNGIPIEAA